MQRPFSALEAIMNEENLGLAIGEYFSSTADKNMDIISLLSDLATSDDLDVQVEELENIIDSRKQSIINKAILIALSTDPALDAEQLSVNSTVMQGVIQTLIDRGDVEVNAFINDYDAFFGEYSDKALAFCQSSIDDIVYILPEYQNAKVAMVGNVLEEHGISSTTPIAIDVGYIHAEDLFQRIIDETFLEQELSVHNLLVYDINDNLISQLDIDINTDYVLDQVKTNAAGCYAWASGFVAASKKSISDAIAYFDTNIASVFSDMTSSMQSAVSFVRAKLTAVTGSVSSFARSAYIDLGWQQAVDDTFMVPSECPMWNYTGVTPLAAFTNRGAFSTIRATAKTAFALASGVVSALFGTLISGLHTVWSSVSEVFSGNPDDLPICSSSDDSFTVRSFSLTCDKNNVDTVDFVREVTSSNKLFSSHGSADPEGYKDQWLSTVRTILNKMIDNQECICLNTIPAWAMIKPVSFSLDDDSYLTIKYSMVIKPRVLSVVNLIENGVLYTDYSTTMPDPAATVMDRYRFISFGVGDASNNEKLLKALSSENVYSNDDASEGEKAFGLWAGLHLFLQAVSCPFNTNDISPGVTFTSNFSDELYNCHLSTTQLGSVMNTSIYSASDSTEVYWIKHGSYDRYISITNADFVKLTSGYHYDSYLDKEVYGAIPIDVLQPSNLLQIIDFNGSAAGVGLKILYLWLFVKLSQTFDPDPVFLPYLSKDIVMPDGRYKIKTDADNYNAASIICTAIALIVITTVAAVTVKSISKVIKRRKYFKHTARVGRLDNAMWNGATLTKKEKKQYLKSQKKLNKLSSITQGFTGSLSSVERIVDNTQTLTAALYPNQTGSGDASFQQNVTKQLNKIG